MESLPSRTCTGVLRKRLLHFRNDPIFEKALDLKDEEEQKDEIVNSFRKSKSKPSLVTKEGNGKGGQKGKKLQAVRGERSYVQCNETLYHCSVFDCKRWRRKTYEESAVLIEVQNQIR
uniref:Bm13121 n=1 Tax=Brugia malayi TaxID=6279 RepID=A0A1I9G2V6_BRUMA|nr:Bm13121 [Brugia malayi]